MLQLQVIGYPQNQGMDQASLRSHQCPKSPSRWGSVAPPANIFNSDKYFGTDIRLGHLIVKIKDLSQMLCGGMRSDFKEFIFLHSWSKYVSTIYLVSGRKITLLYCTTKNCDHYDKDDEIVT